MLQTVKGALHFLGQRLQNIQQSSLMKWPGLSARASIFVLLTVVLAAVIATIVMNWKCRTFGCFEEKIADPAGRGYYEVCVWTSFLEFNRSCRLLDRNKKVVFAIEQTVDGCGLETTFTKNYYLAQCEGELVKVIDLALGHLVSDPTIIDAAVEERSEGYANP